MEILRRELNKLPAAERDLVLTVVATTIDISEVSMTTSQKIQAGLAFVFGVVFLSVILAIAIFIPKPTDFQYQVFRITLALAAGGIGAVIPGILNVDIPRLLTAGGALAVFVVVYFYSPAQLIIKPDSITISIPKNTTFRQAAELIAEKDSAVVEFRDFTELELNVEIKQGPVSAADYKSLLEHLRFRAEHSVPAYRTDHESGKYTLIATHGPPTPAAST